MGGVGSGGHRQGAGRPKKSKAERRLDGNAGHRGRVLAHPSVPPPPTPPVAPDIADFAVPDDLSVDERHVWLREAPKATRNGTLTKDTEYAFILFCRNVVLERALRLTEGGSASHRGMIQRVEAELGDFKLRAFGKTVSDVETVAVDPLESKYFGTA